MTQLPEHYQDVGPGWTAILERLHAGILALDPTYQVFQVKEKFGGLRVYLNRESTEVEVLIERAEAEAEHICEQCGKPGEINTQAHWMKILCPEHVAERTQQIAQRWS